MPVHHHLTEPARPRHPKHWLISTPADTPEHESRPHASICQARGELPQSLPVLARGLDADAILEESERRFPTPDLTLIFEIDPKRGLARVDARGGVAEPVFEELGFLERVAEEFARIDRDHIVRIDGDRAPGEVEADVIAAVQFSEVYASLSFGVHLPFPGVHADRDDLEILIPRRPWKVA